MSDALRTPWEKTIALGGVATGSMKAKDALRVQGIITYRGFRLMDWDWVRTHKEHLHFLSPLRHTHDELCVSLIPWKPGWAGRGLPWRRCSHTQ